MTAPASGEASPVEAAARALYENRVIELDQDGDTDWDGLPESWREEWRDGARPALTAGLAGDWLERVIERHQWTWIVPVDGWNVKCKCDEWQGSQAEHIAHQAAAIRAAAGVGL